MLRTFCSNPGLGGFGNESTFRSTTNDTKAIVTPDAFCQIIKELVDNAVDACTSEMPVTSSAGNDKVKSCSKKQRGEYVDTTTTTTAKRVRVVIESFMKQKDINGENESNNELLKVTVSDNGCGMKDIQTCVGAFNTSKVDYANGNNSKKAATSEKTAEKSNESPAIVSQTAGRYGIGLTLCLLHAQRLVPDSCASIQSAMSTDSEWTVMSVVVDTASDTVRCFPRKGIPKSAPTESGTAVSILVPGGPSATLAWPRLAEYFARFKLSLHMTCSLEVLAPTLSRVPLWVRPHDMDPIGITKGQKSLTNCKKATHDENDESLDFSNVIGCSETLQKEGNDTAGTTVKEKVINRERIQIWKATQTFLGRPIDLANVAHASVPIRIETNIPSKRAKKKVSFTGPRLIVDVIVHGSDNVEEGTERQGNSYCKEEVSEKEATCSKSASMVLIRMVNKIPLLDSAEAAACGLIYGLASKKRMWNSFGLDVNTNMSSVSTNTIPTFDVRDSDQVLPFFNQGAHNLLDRDDDSENDDESELGTKRKRHHGLRRLLPASVRLGNILIIAQIHAEPATLPLPTLCKGRLPIGNKSIDDALEVGITQCLQQLQKTNPNLLFTAVELRNAEYDARYVPSISLALASILSNSNNDRDETSIEKILEWDMSELSFSANYHKIEQKTSVGVKFDKVQTLSMLIERRLRLVTTKSTKVPKSKKGKKTDVDEKGGVRCVRSSSSNIDAESGFRNEDFLTTSQSDENEVQQETKHDINHDSDFEVWL